MPPKIRTLDHVVVMLVARGLSLLSRPLRVEVGAAQPAGGNDVGPGEVIAIKNVERAPQRRVVVDLIDNSLALHQRGKM